MEKLKLKAIHVRQNERSFFLFKMKAGDLLNIAYFNRREIDRESGIQRPYNTSRSRDIAEYVDEEDSVLPNNIIVNLNKDLIKYSSGELEILHKKNVAFVIDGQHRLRAFQYTAKQDFELPVSAFVDLSLAEVAEIFVKINYYQKPVNKSLVFDLLGISEDIFPEFVEAHKVTKILNETIGSPWFDSIKMLGVGKGIITQASFITALESNRILDSLLSEFTLDQKVKILSNYFSAIKKLFPDKWGHRGSIIAKTLGFNAFVRFLPKVFKSVVKKTNGFKVDDIVKILKPLQHFNFEAENISSLGGIKGVKTLANLMEAEIFGE